MRPRHKAFLMLLAVSAIWGFAGPVIKFTQTSLPTPIFLAYRFLLSSLILIPILISSGHLHFLQRLSPHDWLVLILNGLLGSSIELGLLFWGFSYTTSLDGTLISCTSPIMTAVAGHYLLKERVSKKEKIGLAIAFFGSIVLILEPILATGQIFSGTLFGNFLIFLSVLTWVVHTIITKTQLRQQLPPLFLTTSMFTLGALSMLLILPLLHSRQEILSALSSPFSAHLGVWYMALVSGALAYFLYQKAAKTIEVSEANVFTYLSPLFALPLSVFWLKEPLSPFLVLGCGIVALGVVWGELKR